MRAKPASAVLLYYVEDNPMFLWNIKHTREHPVHYQLPATWRRIEQNKCYSRIIVRSLGKL